MRTLTELLSAFNVTSANLVKAADYKSCKPEEQALLIKNGYPVKVITNSKGIEVSIATEHNTPKPAFIVSGKVIACEQTEKDGKKSNNYAVTINCTGSDKDSLLAMRTTHLQNPNAIPHALGVMLKIYVRELSMKYEPINVGDIITIDCGKTIAGETTYVDKAAKDGLIKVHNQTGVWIEYSVTEKATIAKSAAELHKEELAKRKADADYYKEQIDILANDEKTLANMAKLNGLGFSIDPKSFM